MRRQGSTMTEEAFTEEDAEYHRLDRFTARREMINTLKRMGIRPRPMQLDTPKGAIKASKLKEMYKDLTTEEDKKLIQIGQQFDRPPVTGKISGLVELTRKERLAEPKMNATQGEFKVVGKAKLDYFTKSGIPKLARHSTSKDRTKK